MQLNANAKMMIARNTLLNCMQTMNRVKNNAHRFRERYHYHIKFRCKMLRREEQPFYCPQTQNFWLKA